MYMFIGIDPSLNSTGLCFQLYDDKDKIYEKFYIVKPDKLTKKEKTSSESILVFDYVIYDKYDLTKYNDNNHLHEYYKTLNMICLIDKIYDTILCEIEKINDIGFKAFIVMEGISYGSRGSAALADLAGLNFAIRMTILGESEMNFNIIAPTSVKKFAVGNGGVEKDVMIASWKKLDKNISDITEIKLDDLADSFFIAHYK